MSSTGHEPRNRLALLLHLLLCFNPSVSYFLKGCTVDYSDNITSVECTYRNLNAIPDDIPLDAVSLDLSNNHIEKINVSDLRGLSELKYFQATDNLISHVDDYAFSDLGLVELDLGSNLLTNLTDHMFHGMEALVSLILEKNGISHISQLAFEPLISLETLVLMYNQLGHVTDFAHIFQLPKLNQLILGFNRFSSFESDDLPFIKSNITLLWLTGNLLYRLSIKRDIFPHLQSLYISSKRGFVWDVSDPAFLRSLTNLELSVFSISPQMFQTMLKTVQLVKDMSVSYMITNIEVDVACQSLALTSFDLSYNKFISINDSSLRSCSEVIKLDLSSGAIEDLSEFSLISMKQLEHLDLHRNFLTRVPPALRGLGSLQTLDLSFNIISELGCSDFLNLTRLVSLNLTQNSISTLKGCFFKDLKKLKVLRIGENKVYRLVDFFKINLRKLEYLDLHNNELKMLKKEDFMQLSSLISLDLESETDFFIHKGALDGLDNLQTLSATPVLYNRAFFGAVDLRRLEHLRLHLMSIHTTNICHPKNETDFSEFPSLKSLVIQNYEGHHPTPPDLLKGLRSLAHIKAVALFTAPPHPDTFIDTPHLKSLQIVQSGLEDIDPKLFKPIPQLKNLNMSQNKLRSLDFLIRANLSNLSRLTLRYNELSLINETVLQSLPALTYLDLFGNPFICDCSNNGFIHWLKNNSQTQVVYANQYDCAFPPAKKETKLVEVDLQSCEMDVGFLCFISTTCLVVLTLFISFTYHFLRWQIVYTYYLFLAFLYDRRKGKPRMRQNFDAFVSYNVHDEAWVYAEMLPVLEGEQGWRLCLHHRDFQPGKPIVENITDAIYSSRKTICVISRHYLQSEWCSMELQMASFRLFDEKKDLLILLFVEDIPTYQLTPYYRMRKLLKTRSYLSWPQAGRHTVVFWQNVRRALDSGDAENTELLMGPQC